MLLLRIADLSLFWFHVAFVLFNCTGWIWKRTRKFHLLTLSATAASWLILGLWFGPGYCVCTDLHWRVRAALGEPIRESTFMQHLVTRLTGWTPEADITSNATAVTFGVIVILSLWINLPARTRWRQRK